MTDVVRLLLVEDNPDDADLVVLELERAGFRLDWARVDNDKDLRAALGVREWDIIISDFSMPTFDGLLAFQVAQELRREVPFIFVSGALGEERAVQAIRAGARDYIVKTRFDQLPEAVRRELSGVTPLPSKAKHSLSAPPQLDAIARFAHDLNNQLAVIISYGRFVQKSLDETSRSYDDVRRMVEAARRAEAVTRDMLMLSHTLR